jgi:hypothetical protein
LLYFARKRLCGKSYYGRSLGAIQFDRNQRNDIDFDRAPFYVAFCRTDVRSNSITNGVSFGLAFELPDTASFVETISSTDDLAFQQAVAAAFQRAVYFIGAQQVPFGSTVRFSNHQLPTIDESVGSTFGFSYYKFSTVYLTVGSTFGISYDFHHAQ